MVLALWLSLWAPPAEASEAPAAPAPTVVPAETQADPMPTLAVDPNQFQLSFAHAWQDGDLRAAFGLGEGPLRLRLVESTATGGSDDSSAWSEAFGGVRFSIPVTENIDAFAQGGFTQTVVRSGGLVAARTVSTVALGFRGQIDPLKLQRFFQRER